MPSDLRPQRRDQLVGTAQRTDYLGDTSPSTGELSLPVPGNGDTGHAPKGLGLGADHVRDDRGDGVGAGPGRPIDSGVVEAFDLLANLLVHLLEQREHRGGDIGTADRCGWDGHGTLCRKTLWQDEPMGAKPVLLVHGAWHGAWCWEPVIAALADRDVAAVAVDLPGHGDDTEPLTDLRGDALRVRCALDAFDEPVVLVGHSYGGVVITEAGVHPRASDLVYVASFNVDEDESAMSAAVAQSAVAAIDHSGRPDALSHFQMAEDGTATIDAEGARVLFYNDCSPEIAQWAVDRLGPHSMASMSQSPAAVAWRHRPSTYAICTLDNIVHPDLQRLLARRADHVVEWPTGHSPFLSRPDLVADLIADVAARGD
jgi:pimeloyl-ACP methyl ester carboxylesterase